MCHTTAVAIHFSNLPLEWLPSRKQVILTTGRKDGGSSPWQMQFSDPSAAVSCHMCLVKRAKTFQSVWTHFLNNNYRVLYWIARGNDIASTPKRAGVAFCFKQYVLWAQANKNTARCMDAFSVLSTRSKKRTSNKKWMMTSEGGPWIRGTSNLPRYSASSNWRTIGAKGWESTPKNSTNNLRAWNSPSSQSHSTAILDWTNCEIHSPPKAIKHPQLASAKPKHLGHLHSNLFMDCRPTRAPRSTPSLSLRKDGENGRLCRKPSKPSFCVRKFARIHFWQVWACPTVGLDRRKMCPSRRGCVKCLTRCTVRSSLLRRSWRGKFLTCPIARRKTGGFCCVVTQSLNLYRSPEIILWRGLVSQQCVSKLILAASSC